FRPEDIELTVKDNTLFIAAQAQTEGTQPELLYRGIAGRAFERRFALAEHIVVEGANMDLGLLHVSLRRVVPEALKARRIPVGTSVPQTVPQVEAQPEAQAA
ncbi:MAG TPA: Hsp20 family protein, partial [Acetobacteraceae bacterium]|nr:Hsp20 family protein [Acetobacteraceae bacterium]